MPAPYNTSTSMQAEVLRTEGLSFVCAVAGAVDLPAAGRGPGRQLCLRAPEGMAVKVRRSHEGRGKLLGRTAFAHLLCSSTPPLRQGLRCLSDTAAMSIHGKGNALLNEDLSQARFITVEARHSSRLHIHIYEKKCIGPAHSWALGKSRAFIAEFGLQPDGECYHMNPVRHMLCNTEERRNLVTTAKPVLCVAASHKHQLELNKRLAFTTTTHPVVLLSMLRCPHS